VPDSQAQVRYAHAVLSGKAKKKDGMDKKTAQEIVNKMHGRRLKSLPKRVRRVR
jgi:hypothetical protein